MKKTLRGIQLIVAWISFGYLINDAAAAITGQWDFKKGDLSATIGQDMGYLDAETQPTISLTKPSPISIWRRAPMSLA